MSHTKGKWSIMAGAPWNILCEGGARIVWCRSEDTRNGEPADIANARHIVDLHNAAESAISDNHGREPIKLDPEDRDCVVTIERFVELESEIDKARSKLYDEVTAHSKTCVKLHAAKAEAHLWREAAQAFRDATSQEAEEARDGEYDPFLERAQDRYNKAATRFPPAPAQPATAAKFACCEACGYQHSDAVVCKCGRLAATPSPAASVVVDPDHHVFVADPPPSPVMPSPAARCSWLDAMGDRCRLSDAHHGAHEIDIMESSAVISSTHNAVEKAAKYVEAKARAVNGIAPDATKAHPDIDDVSRFYCALADLNEALRDLDAARESK